MRLGMVRSASLLDRWEFVLIEWSVCGRTQNPETGQLSKWEGPARIPLALLHPLSPEGAQGLVFYAV